RDPGGRKCAAPDSGSVVLSGLWGCGEVEAGGDCPDCLVKALEERLAASVPAVLDPVTAGEAEGGGSEFSQDGEPEGFGVKLEFVRQTGDPLACDPGAVVLDVSEQGRFGRDQAAGGDETFVPAGVEPGGRRGQRLVQLAKDGAGQVAVGERGQVGGPQLGLS